MMEQSETYSIQEKYLRMGNQSIILVTLQTLEIDRENKLCYFESHWSFEFV